MRAGVRFYENSLHAPHLPPRSSTTSHSIIPRSHNSSKNYSNIIADDTSVVSISDLSTNSSAQSSNPEDHTARLNMAGRTPHAKQITANNNFEQLKENLFFNESMFKLPDTVNSSLQKFEADITTGIDSRPLSKGTSGSTGPLTDISNIQQLTLKRSETKIQSSVGIAELKISNIQDRKMVQNSESDLEFDDAQKSLIMDQNFTASEKPNRLPSPETADKSAQSGVSLSLSQNSNQPEASLFAPTISARPKLSGKRVESALSHSSSVRAETAQFHSHQSVEESFLHEDIEIKRQHSAELNATLAAKKKAINASLSVDFDAISPNSKGSASQVGYTEYITGIQRKGVAGMSDSALISPLTVESSANPTAAAKQRQEKSFLSDLSSSLQADSAMPQKVPSVDVNNREVAAARYSQSHAEHSYINNLLLGSDTTQSVNTIEHTTTDKRGQMNETVLSSQQNDNIQSAPSDSDTSKSVKSYNTINIFHDGGVSLNRRGPKSRPTGLAMNRESSKRSVSAPPVSSKSAVVLNVPKTDVNESIVDATLNESVLRGNTSTFSYYNSKALMSQKAMNSSAIIDQPHWVGATPRSDRKRPPAIPPHKESSFIADTRVRSSHKKRKNKASPKSMKTMSLNQASSSSYRHVSTTTATTTNHVTVHAPTAHAPLKPNSAENSNATHGSRNHGESGRGHDRALQSEIAMQHNSSRSLSPIVHRQRTIMNEIAQSVYEPSRVDREMKNQRSKSASSVNRPSVEDNFSCISTIASSIDNSRKQKIHTPPMDRHSSPTFMSYRKIQHDSDSDDELGIALSELLGDALAIKQYNKTEMGNARSPPGTDENHEIHSMYTQYQMMAPAHSIPGSIVVSPSDTFPSTSSLTKSVSSGPTAAAAVVAAMNRVQTVPRSANSLSRTSSRTSLGNAMRITKHQADLEEIQSIVIPQDESWKDGFHARRLEYKHSATQLTPESQRFADVDDESHQSVALASILKCAETPGMDTILTDMAVKLSNTETNDNISFSQSYHNTTAHMSSNITLAETTVTLDHSYLLDETGLITPSDRAQRSPIPRMAIRSLARGEDSIPDVKEIAFVSVPGKGATVRLSFANKQNKPLKLKAQSIQIRFESIHQFFYPHPVVTANDVARVEDLQHAAEAKVGNFNSFEVSPNILQIQPNCNGQLFITFSPLPELVGNYSGALKIKYFKKSFILLLRGEAREKLPSSDNTAYTSALPKAESVINKDQPQNNSAANRKLVHSAVQETVARQPSNSPMNGSSSVNTQSTISDGEKTHPQVLSAAELTVKACNSLFERQQELKNKIKSLSAPRVEAVQSSDSESMRTFIDDDVRFGDAGMASAGLPDCMSVITFNQEDSCANISVQHGGNSAVKKASDHPFSTAKSVISQINYSMGSDYKHAEKSFDYYSVAADRFQFSARHQTVQGIKDAYSTDMYRSSLMGNSVSAPPQQHIHSYANIMRDGGNAYPQFTPLQAPASSNSGSIIDEAHAVRTTAASAHFVNSFAGNNHAVPSSNNQTTGTAYKQSSMNTTFDSFINPQSTSQLIEVKTGVYFRKTKNHFGSVTIGSLTRSKIELCNSTDSEVTVNLRDPNLPFVLIHNEVSLRARSYVRVPVRFLPVTCDDFSAELVAETSDGKFHASILLTGSAHS